MKIEAVQQLEAIDFDKAGGLVPLVAQHARTGEVLMLGYADREAVRRTLATGEVWYYSRSRQRLWRKGETSGNLQRLTSLHLDCDGDALVALVEPAGPSCHTGAWSCFGAPPVLAELAAVIEARATSEAPAASDSYTVRLLADRNLRLKKLAEEAMELAVACAEEDGPAAAEEAADLLYHLLVACRGAGVGLDAVLAALERRRGPARKD